MRSGVFRGPTSDHPTAPDIQPRRFNARVPASIALICPTPALSLRSLRVDDPAGTLTMPLPLPRYHPAIMSTAIKQALPNLITMARLVLAVAFFVLLAWYHDSDTQRWLINTSIVLFLLGVTTDFLDGYLARKWAVVSVFGRVMDPLCDKILILGALIMLAGPGFVRLDLSNPLEPHRILISGIQPWMVVLILFREMLVTGLRSLAESRGIAFSAVLSGKVKMVLQSAVIPIVLLLVGNFDPRDHEWSAITRDVLVWSMVVVTVISGLPYVFRARLLLKA